MPVLRFFMLLSLVVWVGGIIFFAFVLAPTVFKVLPTHQLAGAVVNRALPALHWMGVVAGVVYAGTSMAYARLTAGAAQPAAARHLLIYAMIVLTLVSQLAIVHRMAALRTEIGDIDRLPPDHPLRLEFNRWHQWSTRLEGTVLLFGLAVLYLTARRLS